MQQLNYTPDPNNQISAFLMDNLKPIQLMDHPDTSIKIHHYIKPLIQSIKLITDIGELEHSSDWDPSIKVTLHNGTEYETEPGYYNMAILNEKLILENAIEEESETIPDYQTIPINEIQSIEIIRN